MEEPIGSERSTDRQDYSEEPRNPGVRDLAGNIRHIPELR
jgi:hypothetical protein